MTDDISVLIVDDSALMRNLISKMVETTPGLSVVDTAMNGKFALEKIKKYNPDVIVLDLEMPEMNGIEFLRERKKQGIKIPVIILSSVAEKGASVTMEALNLGASDFVQKPSGSISIDIATVKDRVSELLLAYGGRYHRLNKKQSATVSAAVSVESSLVNKTVPSKTGMAALSTFASDLGITVRAPAQKIAPVRQTGKIEVVAIGISTGGPEALRVVFSKLDPDLKVPILVVQHMPPGFTREFALSLDKICPLAVKEAEEGDELIPGRILIAQGNKHLELTRENAKIFVNLSQTPQVSGHRPSADVLFASVAVTFTNHALGVIMTGMGKDGAQQLGNIYREGGLTIGQDETSSVVYGMPRVAYELGHVMEQVSLENMGKRISSIAKNSRL
ncbi:MAG: chemotaxis response regulator protein-glutamate methylesterase [Spirochaetaceae bacterium]|jgi:two-component system chemotaxis response regulator CheB|nr:chemotaxis response regulator protein-glutamate methylesterase [Spirochaetaceae bacterium]